MRAVQRVPSRPGLVVGAAATWHGGGELDLASAQRAALRQQQPLQVRDGQRREQRHEESGHRLRSLRSRRRRRRRRCQRRRRVAATATAGAGAGAGAAGERIRVPADERQGASQRIGDSARPACQPRHDGRRLQRQQKEAQRLRTQHADDEAGAEPPARLPQTVHEPQPRRTTTAAAATVSELANPVAAAAMAAVMAVVPLRDLHPEERIAQSAPEG